MVFAHIVRSSRTAIGSVARAAHVRNFASATEVVRKTELYDFHVKNGGNMVPFAGWSLPVKYDDLGVIASHIHTRENASVFDVSHMLQTRVVGKDRIKFIEKLVVGDIEGLPVHSSALSVFTNENGGIIDDTIICKHQDSLYIVSNAGCAEKDLAHLTEQLKKFQNEGADVDLKVIDTHSLLALQGPKAAGVLEALAGESLNTLQFMNSKFMTIKGIECHVARSGYTGEDGFELSIPHGDVVKMAELFLGSPGVAMAGLGARDSLRLEAGMCLYGHDLNDTITPVEAGLTWTIGKRRRAEGGFLGADKILPQIKNGVEKKRVGLIVKGAPARENAIILNAQGEEVGIVTSGCPSPSRKENIAMGYVKTAFAKNNTELKVKVRNRVQDATVVKMPFVPAQYFKS